MRHPRLDRGSQLNKHEEVHSLKARFHKSRPLWISRGAATGLISIEKVSNNPDEDSRIQEDVPEALPPTPQDCASAVREQNLHR